ncbi:MAG: valine--tRNA ligase [Pseudonocardiales bacterium]|nr:valine--tRNA ligase [Pseudonocardiales bacterium]MBV9029315.1 valine--tRNA ligase [Pseudonocardiales bacterium]
MESSEYDSSAVEAGVRSLWEDRDVYRYDPAAGGPVFSIDTPPPYVSASHLHVGHAMSYSQADFVVRYHRMRGERIFYPMGFDDNGLPTERFVEQKYGITAADIPRAKFIELCMRETRATAARYEDLWRRVGLSVDWSQTYSTIDPRCQATAQTSFIKLRDAGYIRRSRDPILWCVECRTALAQADVEDLERKGRIHRIAFSAVETGQPLVIATTRPELLAACVAVYFHPGDERYADLEGTFARVPVFGHEVPIKADESVDPEFGTGLMMVCTFGDLEDVNKWRQDSLDLRLVLGSDGRFDQSTGPLAGRDVDEARRVILDLLKDSGELWGSTSVRQVVGVHERCGTPVEFQIRSQWFVRIMEHRDRFRVRATELVWAPESMKRRLDDWIDGLKWDWNITRQRHYGVPFPVWYRLDGDGAPIQDDVLMPELSALPVDPGTDLPPGFTEDQRGRPGGFTGDPDVMDTWMTSSLSPQIIDGWAVSETGSDPALAPMSLRVQAFEIIRTWLFYTLVQSELHFGRVPWETVMISGWGLGEQGKKISKRDLEKSTGADGFNRYVPNQVIARYGADALRLWAASARLGNDLRYSEKDVRVGRKLTVKLWNVGRFMSLHLEGFDPSSATPIPVADRSAVDRWVLAHLAETVEEATAAFDHYDFMQAHKTAARFFWSVFCDRYLEMIKDRFLDPDRHSDVERLSARWTMWEAYRRVLALFAPFAPFVTERLYQRFYADREKTESIHVSLWPTVEEHWRTDPSDIDQMVVLLDAVRALRSARRLHSGTRISRLILDTTQDGPATLAHAVAEPLRTASRADTVVFASAEHPSGVDGIAVGIEP